MHGFLFINKQLLISCDTGIYAIIENKYLSGENFSMDRNSPLKGGPCHRYLKIALYVISSANIVLSRWLSLDNRCHFLRIWLRKFEFFLFNCNSALHPLSTANII